jgi:hypothetical protein
MPVASDELYGKRSQTFHASRIQFHYEKAIRQE